MLTLAVHFFEKGTYKTNQTQPGSKRKIKMSGYQVSKFNYRVLKLALGDLVEDIPRSRIVDYRYIRITPSEKWRAQGRYFLIPIEDSLLTQLEGLTKSEYRPRVYLWRDEGWHPFPQIEEYADGETQTITITRTEYGSLLNLDPQPKRTVEHKEVPKVKRRIRQTYEPSKGPGFQLASSTPTGDTNPAGFPTTITGNGMILEWKRGYDDKPPVWWIRDAAEVPKAQSQTYKHYQTLKSTPGARWSRGFRAWYLPRETTPPQAWLDLLGIYANTSEPTVEKPPEKVDPATLAERMKPYRDYHALRQFRQRFNETYHHLTCVKALPAMATPSLDDPWS